MAANPVHRMTVEEFSELPRPVGNYDYELRHGEYEKEQMCMAHGCQKFWVADLDKQYVRVALANGPTITYRPGNRIPLKLFGDASLPVDNLFLP